MINIYKNKKVNTKLTVNLNDNEEYCWIGFELSKKYYIGFESDTEIQAIVVSEKFFKAFKEEFETT